MLFAVPIRIFGLQPARAGVRRDAGLRLGADPARRCWRRFALLALGLFLDLFWGAPLGLWASRLLVAYGVGRWSPAACSPARAGAVTVALVRAR